MTRFAAVASIIVLACAILVLLPEPTLWAASDLSGDWEYSCWGYRLDMQLRQHGQAVRGVAYLSDPVGSRDPYHLSGMVRGARVVLSHPSGHSFRGRVVSTNEISGVLTTAEGKRWAMTAQRR